MGKAVSSMLAGSTGSANLPPGAASKVTEKALLPFAMKNLPVGAMMRETAALGFSRVTLGTN
jgi:hypothetical protein